MIGDVVVMAVGLFGAVKGIERIVEGLKLATGGTRAGGALVATGVGAPVGAEVIAVALTGAGALIGTGAIELGACLALVAEGGSNFGSDLSDFRYYEKLACDLIEYSEYWSKGSFGSPQENLQKHFEKHGDELGAKDLGDYAKKANSFKETVLSKKIKGNKASGFTGDVYHYKYNGKYIRLEHIQEGYNVTYKIVSYGKQLGG